MADDPQSQGRLTRASTFVFLHTEHAIYAALGLLLAFTALIALIDAVGLTWEAMRSLGGASQTLEVVDRLLFLLMLVEILHTVRQSITSDQIAIEPFLIVGLIASVRRILIVTVEVAQEGKGASTDQFMHAMIELGVLGGLTLVLIVSIYLSRLSRKIKSA